jgi:hypothetical protein
MLRAAEHPGNAVTTQPERVYTPSDLGSVTCHGLDGLGRYSFEVWAPIPGWPHEASTRGRVRSITRRDTNGVLRFGHVLAQKTDKRPGKGYLYVTLVDGQRRRTAGVHVLVCEAWQTKPGPGYEVGHRNGIRTDNAAVNLAWVTKPQNRRQREAHRQGRVATSSQGLDGPDGPDGTYGGVEGEEIRRERGEEAGASCAPNGVTPVTGVTGLLRRLAGRSS